VIEGYARATLELLAERALLRRVDTKFIVGLEDVAKVLRIVDNDYALLLAAERPIARYRTLYYDSPNYQSLVDHDRGRRPRYKVRVRHYVDRKLSYLEIKKKTNANRTQKVRREIPFLRDHLTGEDRQLADERSNLPGADLIPTLWTDFDRITLVGLRTKERVTVDLSLRFEGRGKSAGFPQLAVVEVKQARFSPRSPIMLALRGIGARPLAMSKYCTAATMLLPCVSMRRYRSRVRAIGRM